METASDGTSILLGQADLDLAKYANNPQMLQDKLTMKQCEDENAYIEINIKTNAQEVVGNPAEMNREAPK